MTVIIDRNKTNRKIKINLTIKEIRHSIEKIKSEILFIPYKPISYQYKDLLVVRKWSRISSEETIVEDIILFKINNEKIKKIHTARLHKKMSINDIATTYLAKLTNTAAILPNGEYYLDEILHKTNIITD